MKVTSLKHKTSISGRLKKKASKGQKKSISEKKALESAMMGSITTVSSLTAVESLTVESNPGLIASKFGEMREAIKKRFDWFDWG